MEGKVQTSRREVNHNMTVRKQVETLGDDASGAMETEANGEYGESTRCVSGPLPLRQTRLLGILLLVSVVLPPVSPTLEELARMSFSSTATGPLGADAFRSHSNVDGTDGCSTVGELDTEVRGERLFDYMRTGVFEAWASKMTGGDAWRRRDEEEEEDEEDEENKAARSGDSLNDAAEEEGQVVDGKQLQDKTIGRERRILTMGEAHPLAPVEKDRRSTLSSSSIGGSSSSTQLAIGSEYNSLVSTPRKLLLPNALTDHRSVSGDHCADSIDVDDDVNKENDRKGFFEALSDAALLRIFLFLVFPDVVSLLGTNKRLNELLRKKFQVNEHGVFRIPAFTGRPSLADRYGGNFAGNKNHHAKNKNGVSGTMTKNIRLFFGQQRRDPHPASLRHLLNFLVPEISIPHMESHTNALNNRGKGCTWVFVTSQDDVKRLMRFNRLIFLDLNADGREVYMVAPPRSRMWIQEYAENIARWSTRPIYLPRQPMVIEVPEKPSMKRKRLKWQLQNEKNTQAQQVEDGEPIQESEFEQKEQEEQKHHEEVSQINEKEEQHQETTPFVSEASAEADGDSSTIHLPREELQERENAVNETSFSAASSPRMTREGEGALEKTCESSFKRENSLRPSQRKCHNPYSPVYVFYSHLYTTTICLGDGRYRHDPYLYNPLWEPVEPQMVALIKE
ncbi:cyclin-like F-box protein 2 [Trypanosoma cruzi]|uniref:Cyclin-like F-box protein 2 n=1 Tax=Trypanosoma cruzi TaxID=5693 RepID=A0A7J6YDR0_TRYCR|nr:cyclin-like F-box protein 2 [Trypanosoma cruzi]